MSEEKDIIVSDDILYYILLVNFWGPALAVAIFGIVTNALNIITFLKQGTQDAVNISLLGLAISDFLSLVTSFIVGLCYMPAVQALDIPFVAMDVVYVGSWVHVLLTRVTAWITAYITFERCLCIAYPLKVKVIITPRRTIIFILLMSIVMLATQAPVYYTIRATDVFDPVRNRTLQGIYLLPNRNHLETISFVINNITPMTAFFIVIVCTVILVRKLKSKAKWRLKSIGQGKTGDTLSDKDTKVVMMVVFISIIFIFCYSPGAVAYIWVIIDPEMRIDGKHANLLLANFSTLFHLETINASVNIFVYLRMSSKFKNTFLRMFPCFYVKGKFGSQRQSESGSQRQIK